MGVGIASFIGCIDFTIVNTALPAMQKDLHLTFSQLQWIMNVFILALPVLMVIGGRVGDVYGRRKVLYCSVLLFGLSSLGAGLSGDITWLLAFRGLQGIAAAFMWPSAAAVVLHAFPEEEQGRAMGMLYGIFGIGLAIGPVLGGVLVGLLSWRWIFYVNVPVIAISFLICLPTVSESIAAGKQKLDYVGVGLLALGLACVTFSIAEGNNLGWLSPLIIALFVFGLLVLFFWVRHELKSKSPTFNLHLFKYRNVCASLLSSMSLGAFYALGFFMMPLYLDNVRHLSAFATGGMLMATSVLLAVVSPFMGYVMERYPAKYLISIGFLFLIATAIMQMFFGVSTSFTFIIISFVLFGLGWGVMGSPLMKALMDALPNDATGVATGAIWTFQNIGAVFGLALGVAIFQLIIGKSLAQHLDASLFMRGYVGAMVLLLVASLVSLLMALFVMRCSRGLD